MANGHANQRTRPPSSRGELERAVWERMMTRLRTTSRLLSLVLLALVVRAMVTGLSSATELSGATVALLLLASLLLTRRGRRLEPSDSRR